MKPSRTFCPGCNGLYASWPAYLGHAKKNDNGCSQEKRFWGRVNKQGANGCWIFLGCLDGWGYGDVQYRRKHLQAHRLAWMLLRGDPGKMDVLHKCNTPPCCNPDHLYLGTDLENAQDRIAAGTQHSVPAVLTEDEVRAIRAEYWCKGRKSNIEELHAKYPQISKGALYCAASGRSWKALK